METLRVSAVTETKSLAGAIAGQVRTEGRSELVGIGAAAVNQIVKGVALARSYLERDQIDVAMVPSFETVAIEGAERTAIRVAVERRGDGGVRGEAV